MSSKPIVVRLLRSNSGMILYVARVVVESTRLQKIMARSSTAIKKQNKIDEHNNFYDLAI